jgi:hypothetical protein
MNLVGLRPVHPVGCRGTAYSVGILPTIQIWQSQTRLDAFHSFGG